MKFIAFIALFIYSIPVFSQTQVEKKKELTYSSQGFVSSEKTTESNGDVVTKYYRYLADVISPTCLNNPTTYNAQSLKKLFDLNILDNPLETYTVVLRNGISSVISAELHLYYNDKPYIKEIKKLKKKVPYSSFTVYSVASTCFTNISSDYESEETYDSYDSYGNVLQITSKSQYFNSFIYDYHAAYKVAEVNNAQNNEIAYSSFESDGKGFWSYGDNGCVNGGGNAVTGDKVYDMSLGGTIVRNNIPVQKYIVSLWYNGSQPSVSGVISTKVITPINTNPFTYVEYTVNNVSSITISGGDVIDELRLYPFDAEMITTTYRPLVGMTSKADNRNDITYYEYDELGRLELIRDHNKNIVKKLEHKTIKPD